MRPPVSGGSGNSSRDLGDNGGVGWRDLLEEETEDFLRCFLLLEEGLEASSGFVKVACQGPENRDDVSGMVRKGLALAAPLRDELPLDKFDGLKEVCGTSFRFFWVWGGGLYCGFDGGLLAFTGSFTDSGSDSSSESEDKESTLFCRRSVFESTLTFVLREFLDLRLEMLAALLES